VEHQGVNKFLLIITSILGLLVAAILVGPSMINWNNYKTDLTNGVERLTGRKLTINGDIEISIFPAPAVVANDVYLSNSDRASAKNMFSLKSLEIRVALGPLLGGQVKIQTVHLIDPVIELQRFADGHTNMDFLFIEEDLEVKNPEVQIGKTSLVEASKDMQLGENVSAFSLDNFSIENAIVTYRDDMLERIETIEKFDATFAAASPAGPFASAGNMVVGGLPLEYTISIDRIIEERTAPFSLTISLIPGQTKTSFSGAIIGLDETPRFEGLVKATGKNLAELVQFARPKSSLPGLLGQEFGFEAKVAASAEAADISELSVSLGNAVAKGSAGLIVKGTPNVDISLALDSLDLDKWLAFPKIRAAITGVSKNKKIKIEETEPISKVSLDLPDKAGTSAPNGSTELSDFMDVKFNITAKSLAFNSGLVRHARLSVELSDGEVIISHASAKLPGNADVALFGFVLTEEALPRFDGKMEVSVGNVRGMMDWLDAPMPPVPADRLLKIVLSGDLQATQNMISVSQLDLQFDSSRLTGSAAVKLAERLSVDADLVLDRLNLDAYLSSSKTRAISANKLDVQNSAPKATTKLKPREGVTIAPLAALKNFDANFKSRIKTVVYGNAQVRNINLDLSLLNGIINVRHLSVEKLAGSTFKARGSFSNIEGIPKMKGVSIDANFSDLSRFFRLLGGNIPQISIGMGNVTLAGKIDGPVLTPLVELELEGAGANIMTSGKMSFLPLVGGFVGNLKVVHGNLVGMLKSLGSNHQFGGKLGGFDLDSAIKADKTGLTLGNLKAHVGHVPVNGTIKILLGGPKTKVEADLNTGRIAVNQFLPVSAESLLEEKAPSFAPVRSLGEPTLKGSTDFSPGRWPTNPIDLSYLEIFDADIKLRSKSLVHGKYSINNSVLEATINAGVLQIDKLSGDLFGGTVNATATAKAASPLTIESRVSLNNLSLEKGLLAAIGESPAKGRAGMDIKLASSGYTVSDLVAGLEGGGSIGLEGINVSRGGKGTSLSSVLGLLSELNNVGGRLSGKRANAGLADIIGTFKVSKGIAQSGDLTLASSMGNGQAQGKVDLSRWLINVAGQFEISQNFIGKVLNNGVSATSKLPFSIRGDLDAPNVKLDTSKLLSGGLIIKGLDSILKKKGVGSLLQNIIPGLTGSSKSSQPSSPSTADEGSVPPPSPPQPSQNQQRLPPKDFLKDLLNGLSR
jgi:uncharacterized protein involved in outer membrane biogenesis